MPGPRRWTPLETEFLQDCAVFTVSRAAAAGRELVEETGYRAGELVPIGAISPNPALFGNRVHTFLATGLERMGEPINPGNEETVVELVPERELRVIVRKGGVDHALVIAALHFLDLHREAGGIGPPASGRG